MASDKSSIRRGKLIDLAGQVVGRLTVLCLDRMDRRNGQSRAFWKCRCSCGTEVSVVSYSLRSGGTLSCGCLNAEQRRVNAKKHGACGTPEYLAWESMLRRCLNPNTKDFARYGGRGITVCAEWRANFSAFLQHIGPMPSPSHQLDRIKNDGNYEPGNVRWTTRQTQSRNRRNNRMIEYGGEICCLQEWSERLGIHRQTLADRIDKCGVQAAISHYCSANRTLNQSTEIS